MPEQTMSESPGHKYHCETPELASTHHIKPRPSYWISSPIPPFNQHQHNCRRNPQNTEGENPHDQLPDSPLAMPASILVEAPDLAEEHAANRHAHQNRMPREYDIVSSYSGLRADRVARSILGANQRRPEERDGRDKVGNEAKDVDYREGEGRANSRAPTQVEKRLGVEGERPGDSAGTED